MGTKTITMYVSDLDQSEIPAVVFYVVARRALQQSVAGGLAGT